MPGSHLKYKFLDIKALKDRKDDISRGMCQYCLVNIYKGKKSENEVFGSWNYA